jgi:hypothetical protein
MRAAIRKSHQNNQKQPESRQDLVKPGKCSSSKLIKRVTFQNVMRVEASDITNRKFPTGRSRGQINDLAAGIAVRKSSIDGLGCFAAAFFPRHGIIAEYRGERITNQEAKLRMQTSSKPQISQVDEDWSIDGSIGGNGTQYLNHSCDPNSSVQIIDEHIMVIAERDIFPGEEITVDYLNSYESDRSSCNCRSTNCRKRTTPAKQ